MSTCLIEEVYKMYTGALIYKLCEEVIKLGPDAKCSEVLVTLSNNYEQEKYLIDEIKSVEHYTRIGTVVK